MSNITIKPIGIDDEFVLKELCETTFRETFEHDNTEEQLAEFFAEAYAPDVLKAELEDPNVKEYFVMVDGKHAGYLKVNVGDAQTEHKLDNAFEVQRIYILKAYQGLGLGKKLFEFALQEACKTTCDWVWLGVWERNFKAQNFYSKYGFTRFSEHKFLVGEKVDIDWLLKADLNQLRERFGVTK